jgi:hypothetical protein
MTQKRKDHNRRVKSYYQRSDEAKEKARQRRIQNYKKHQERMKNDPIYAEKHRKRQQEYNKRSRVYLRQRKHVSLLYRVYAEQELAENLVDQEKICEHQGNEVPITPVSSVADSH